MGRGLRGVPLQDEQAPARDPEPALVPVLHRAGDRRWFLPFSAIYIELHYVFNSIWGSKIYTLYGILSLAALMVACVGMAVVLLFTYFHLNAEDYRWWWRSYLSGASVSLFFLAFCVYYYFSTNMSGVLQTSFFFLYSGLAAYAVSLVMGSLGFLAAMRFVFYIYSQIKSE